MNPLKKGPEIKFSDLKPSNVKVPQVLSDLYWDLRDRYLLPAVVVLIVAIAAVPLLLGGSSDTDWQKEVASGDIAEEVAGASSAAASGGQLVAKAMPGLRDYRRRLHDLQEKDPFIQQFNSSGEVASESAGSSEGTPTESTTVPATSESTPESSGGALPDEPDADSPELAWFSYAIDVRVVALGQSGGAAGRASASAAKSESTTTVRRNLPELTVLPNRQTPAAIYMGVTKDGKKALLMLSDQVQGIFGDATCVLGSASCQLLAVEPGLPVTVVYGPAERTFRIELLKLRLLKSDELNRAPLGAGDEKKGQQKQSDRPSGALSQLSPRP